MSERERESVCVCVRESERVCVRERTCRQSFLGTSKKGKRVNPPSVVCGHDTTENEEVKERE